MVRAEHSTGPGTVGMEVELLRKGALDSNPATSNNSTPLSLHLPALNYPSLEPALPL